MQKLEERYAAIAKEKKDLLQETKERQVGKTNKWDEVVRKGKVSRIRFEIDTTNVGKEQLKRREERKELDLQHAHEMSKKEKDSHDIELKIKKDHVKKSKQLVREEQQTCLDKLHEID